MTGWLVLSFLSLSVHLSARAAHPQVMITGWPGDRPAVQPALAFLSHMYTSVGRESKKGAPPRQPTLGALLTHHSDVLIPFVFGHLCALADGRARDVHHQLFTHALIPVVWKRRSCQIFNSKAFVLDQD